MAFPEFLVCRHFSSFLPPVFVSLFFWLLTTWSRIKGCVTRPEVNRAAVFIQQEKGKGRARTQKDLHQSDVSHGRQLAGATCQDVSLADCCQDCQRCCRVNSVTADVRVGRGLGLVISVSPTPTEGEIRPEGPRVWTGRQSTEEIHEDAGLFFQQVLDNAQLCQRTSQSSYEETLPSWKRNCR